MAQLTPEQQHEFFMQGFNDQLEKQAFLGIGTAVKAVKLLGRFFKAPGKSNLGKWYKGFRDAKKGEKLNYLAKFSNPTELLSRAQLAGTEYMRTTHNMQKGTGLASGLRRQIGNTALNLQTLGSGVRGQGFAKGTDRALSNIWTFSKRQVRGSRYKQINLTDKGIIGDINKGTASIRGGGLLKNKKMFNRKIITTVDASGNKIGLVKKRLPSQVFSTSLMTAPGIVATAPLFHSTDKDGKKIPLAKRYTQSLPEAVSWGIARPIGGAIMATQAAKLGLDVYKKQLRPK